MDERIRLGLIILVGAGWLFNLVAPAVIQTYEPNLAANGPLLLILGAIFTTRAKPPKNGGGLSDHEDG